MEEVLLETAESLPEAVAFANRQFGLDFLQFQSKIYDFPDAGETYTLRKDGQIAGMLSVYPVQYRDVRCLSVGTVCTAPAFRGKGVMTALFEQLERNVFPKYDIVTLCGKRSRYEHFGFAKAMTFPEYWFYAQGRGTLQPVPATANDYAVRYDLWMRYGNGVRRPQERMLAILQSAGHEVFLLSDGTQWGYISWKPQKRLITEYCGPWPVQSVVNTLATVTGDGKIGIISRLNCHDEQLLRTCDSYFIRNHGNIRIPNMDVEKIYDICGYGGGNPHLTLPTSLFFLDGI